VKGATNVPSRLVVGGVQVGAFARAQLAVFYSVQGRTVEAQALAKEVVERFPGAVDHSGRPLVETLRKLKLLSGHIFVVTSIILAARLAAR
jgi:hypothetical protein